MKQKQFFQIIMLALVAGILYINRFELKKLFAGNAAAATPPPPATNTGVVGPVQTTHNPAVSTPATSVALNYNKALSRGSSGAEVRMLQHMLNVLSQLNMLTEDGQFGVLTENKLFQYTSMKSITLNQAANIWHQRMGTVYNFNW